MQLSLYLRAIIIAGDSSIKEKLLAIASYLYSFARDLKGLNYT